MRWSAVGCPRRTSTSRWRSWPAWPAWCRGRRRRCSRWPAPRAGSAMPWRSTRGTRRCGPAPATPARTTGYPAGMSRARRALMEDRAELANRSLPWPCAVSTTPSSTSMISPAPSISTPRRSASKSGQRWPAVPLSCAPLVPRTTTTWACSRSTGPARSPGTPPRGWACTTWHGRSARWPNWTRCGAASPSAAPWSAPVTTGFPSRCTPRTPAASSSR